MQQATYDATIDPVDFRTSGDAFESPESESVRAASFAASGMVVLRP